ncbi:MULTISPECIES: DUF192 domain-containing protein [Mesorhizobium]|uniref:DUF192 domain-containing protein n=1 Tax=Mesorhizobium denitrificans TaxID=2294114 RepID=A0A371X6J7_9HYPH|nr:MULTISPECIES: DUF192 domain-containing protein [Mesorhizobium]RFC64833.1 DUF192 domain-containing protein [Mesorhizobium denitrificans]
MPFRKIRSYSSALVFSLLLLPFAAAWAQEAMVLPVDPAPLVIETGATEAKFAIEVADEGAERSRGLMFRKEMAADHGMLFVFQQQQPLAFWMKNTILPLDLVFIDERGKVRAVLPGTPFSEAPISPSEPVKYVLELNQGTAKRLGIDPGDQVAHPLIGMVQ